ncbi:hypothetical protein B0J15DRAFT_498944 [Fusarium solani]|uniref:Secreted protein n=1 Tax=Fusarium solani TaxID=169388 RepID=A0A9P9GYK1_FUSSL|nr:uncharacterized protein B0J15DRAFT_498944 [Fusarium solani]KAH7247924.1 hypothetical protein B0J15DRAFT_498944 [Fusarium solani]
MPHVLLLLILTLTVSIASIVDDGLSDQAAGPHGSLLVSQPHNKAPAFQINGSLLQSSSLRPIHATHTFCGSATRKQARLKPSIGVPSSAVHTSIAPPSKRPK